MRAQLPPVQVGARPGIPSAPRRRARPPFRMRVSERRLLLMAGDIVASCIAVMVALFLWAQHAQEAFTLEFALPHLYWFAVLPLLWFILASANDYYNLRIAAHLSSSAIRLFRIILQVLAIYLATFFLSPPGSLPRRFIVYYAIGSLILIGLWRACRVFLLGWTQFRRRAIIVGVGQPVVLIWDALKEEAISDYEVLGCVTSDEDDDYLPNTIPILATARDLPQIAQEQGASEIIIAYAGEVPGDVFQGIMTCYEQGVSIVAMPVLYEQVTGRVPIEHVGSHLWTLVLPLEQRTLSFHLYLFARRILDITLSVIGLVLFALMLPFLALAIKQTSPGPVFYLQERVGRGGALFMIYKLRSMMHNAERDSGAQWAAAGDNRITPIGRFLRKTRLDEAPQLINVLRGEMSIVGPRPERPEFVALLEKQIPFYRTRLAVHPGLTGWAQVRFRYGASLEDALRKLQFDLYYIRHQSILLDLEILVRTVSTVLLFRGS